MPNKSSSPIFNEDEGGEKYLLEIIQQIARGNFKALDDLYSMPGREGVSSKVSELAESIGMILVRLEARDFYIELANETEERLEDLNQLKNEYLGIAAHDLKNPISTIRGMSQMLVEMDLDEDTKTKFLKTINRLSDQMLTLVSNFLNVSLIESGKFELQLSPVKLSTLIRDRIEVFEKISSDKHIRISAELNDVGEANIDPSRIGQVLDNILSNAIKFSPEDSTIKVLCEDAGENIKFSVEDEGPGMSEEDLGRLFETFQKASAQPTAGEMSTGLGLSIVKTIIDAHNGQIDVDSEVGKGTKFTVMIPVVDKIV